MKFDAATLTALATVITAVATGFVLVLRELRNNTRITQSNHDLANAQHDAAMARIQQLGNAMKAANIEIPDDPAIPAPARPPAAPA